MADLDAARDQAREAYARAGDHGDHDARRHHLAREVRRDALHAYRAGWRSLAWSNYLSPRAWGIVATTYGASRAWRQPLHLAGWGVLLVVLLTLTIRGFLATPAPVAASRRERDRSESKRSPTAGASRPARTVKPEPAPKPTAKPTAKPVNEQRKAVGDVAKRLARQQQIQRPAPPRPKPPPANRRRR